MNSMATTLEKPEGSINFLGLTPKHLAALSAEHGWSLSELELSAIQSHFKAVGREPSLAEIETVAQTWSEHCKHKTFTGPIRFTEGKRTKLIASLMDETIAKATKELKAPWCLSVFKDNAGVVNFSSGWALAIKVETHNHPCAIEPYGGAETGVGGVVRDILGVGLGAKPVLNTDVFCFARPDYDGPLPAGTLHPKRTLRSVVAGVRDYGNRMGIPTAAGGINFDNDYRLNPLVFVGCAGLMPTWAIDKEVKAGDLIVAAGGRTGRDGLHGATFSSASLTEEAPSSAVQIGHAINEKRVLDALLAARDAKLFRAVTDCGAGGLSSAVGELAAACGAKVQLEKTHLKATDLAPWEIWLSESQERMVFAVPPKNLKAFSEIFETEGCEFSVLGEFTSSGRLAVTHNGTSIVDLDMKFLHKGLPRAERKATWEPPKPVKNVPMSQKPTAEVLREALADLNVCSRESVIRQYDHEVQAGTVIKPLQGVRHDGPGDACVIWPHAATGNVENYAGFALSHGLNPAYGKLDPYHMALACADEALRNLLCVGADISRASFLDNFCWGSPDNPAQLGGLVKAAYGCYDAAKGYGVPFISGKDSFYNQSKDVNGKDLAIPGTLLITAVAPVVDVRQTITMDVKGPGNSLYLVGWTMDEFAGSLYNAICARNGGTVPQVNLKAASAAFKAASSAIAKKLVLSAHDLSEGGLAVAVSEMAFSGEFGAFIDLDQMPRDNRIFSNDVLLFSESQSRIILEVPTNNEAAFQKIMKGAFCKRIGTTTANPILKVAGLDGSIIMEEPLSALKAAWQKTLPEML